MADRLPSEWPIDFAGIRTLRERLRLAFAKATGSFDDFDLLAIVGRSQVGRLRFTEEGAPLDEGVPFQSIDELLEGRRNGDLFRGLLEKFAPVSGISGVQPKFLVRDEAGSSALSGERGRTSQSFRGATHIVKLWDPTEFPEMAANEFFCLQAARRCGLEVPSFRLAEDGVALIIDRFDLRPNATYRGFEDFCVLNARRTDEKYRGSYETAILKRFTQFAQSPALLRDLERLYTLIVLNCALRNGDAHLKNFGLLYDDTQGEVRLAPVYDLVTTTAYLPKDGLALTLDGSTSWPDAKRLHRLAEKFMIGAPSKIRALFARIADALSQTATELRAYMREHPRFDEIGKRMLAAWEDGRRSLEA